ncbi:uncharacterized protein LOC116038584 [Sander lucioperca]|uniref:uncharacterized protein LOC116038584 n=1 Tax=Sander lucioperca TaxID=283035 RepID=UPI001653601B|nr:uncharacterized protein LOC116038584 [Sander lucioperca]
MERSPIPSPAVVGRAKQVTGYLKNLHHLIFLHFMCDTLDHLALLSKDNNTVCQVVESLETFYWNLTALKTEMGPQMAKVYKAVKTNGEYRGVQFQAFDPSCWPKWDRSDGSAQFRESGQEDLRALTRHFSVLLCREGISTEDVMSNFQDYKGFAQGRTSVPMRDTFLNIMKSDERCERFRSLVTLLRVYLVLPVSTAVCERGFSTMTQIKSDWRTSLSSVQLQRLIFLSVEGPKFEDFDAGLVVERWWTCSQRQCRPGFNPWESRHRSEDTEWGRPCLRHRRKINIARLGNRFYCLVIGVNVKATFIFQ